MGLDLELSSSSVSTESLMSSCSGVGLLRLLSRTSMSGLLGDSWSLGRDVLEGSGIGIGIGIGMGKKIG